MRSAENNLILACAGTGLSSGKMAEIKACAARVKNWETVISLSSAHGLLPLVYHSLKQACPDSVPEEILSRLKKTYKDNAVRNIVNGTRLLNIIDLLESENIQAVCFKGPLIAESAYGDLNLRSFTDLDILIKKADVPRAKEVLRQNGYKPEIDLSGRRQEKFFRHENSISFYHKNNVYVDLHWEITGRYLLDPVYLENFSDRLSTTWFLGRQVFTIPEDVMLVYLCVHGTSHCWDRLEWVCCFAELMKRQSDETVLGALRLAEDIGAKRMFLLGLYLGEFLLDARYSDAVRKHVRFDQGIIECGGKISDEIFDAQTHSSEGAAWRFSPMHILIRDSYWDSLKYTLYLFTMPTIKEWSKYRVPYGLTFIYRLIRPFRLAWTFLIGNKLGNSFLSSGFRRIREAADKKRAKGAGYVFTLFFYLPARFVEKAFSGLRTRINKHLYNPYINLKRINRFHDANADKMDKHFYVIGMPGKMDFLEPCIALARDRMNLFVILNGVKKKEKKRLEEKFPDVPMVALSSFFSSPMPHGEVINLLLAANDDHFGLIDHDLYIFNDSAFAQLYFEENEFIAGPFALYNQKAGITFPATFFLFINTPVVKKIMAKYRIGAQIYTRIPSRLYPILKEMNLGYDNFLKAYLNYFDPFNLIFAMAVHEGYQAKIIKIREGDMIHLGSTLTNELTHQPEQTRNLIDSILAR
jgi:hypothetical protein